jgi:hypothetical protein
VNKFHPDLENVDIYKKRVSLILKTMDTRLQEATYRKAPHALYFFNMLRLNIYFDTNLK